MLFEAPESERTVSAHGMSQRGQQAKAGSDTTRAILWAAVGAGLLIVLGVAARLLGLI